MYFVPLKVTIVPKGTTELSLFCLHIHEEQGSTEGNPIVVVPYTSTEQLSTSGDKTKLTSKELDDEESK